LQDELVRKYTAENADHPVAFNRGDVADAEPALRGWTMSVDDIFA
jgi:hypothetical protein